MPTTATTAKNKKLRHNEYYGQQSTLDELYEQSLKGAKFKKLYEKIIDESNILLAYRNIKTNTGSITKGTDDKIRKIRPLGIPTISDRLIQQCILQILEPICEAKFHNHSFGFRPNRSTEHALSTMQK